MNQTQEHLRLKIISTIMEQLDITVSHIALLIAASIIATIGLIQDSSTIIIGAMIISPIFWPIMGIGVSLATGKIDVIKKTFLSFGISFFLVLAISVLITLLVPGNVLTTQVIARTQPTILDLIIALTAAAVGSMSIVSPKNSAKSGVAISISLLPPLCVFGIAIASKAWTVALGAILLFFTNMTAIVFAGVVTFYFLGLLTKNSSAIKWQKAGISVTIISLILLSIPLFFILNTQVKQAQQKSKITSIFWEQAQKVDKTASTEIKSIQFSSYFEKPVIKIDALIVVPEELYITESQQKSLMQDLTNETGSTIELKLSVINTISVRREESEKIESTRKKVEAKLKEELKKLNQPPTVNEITITLPEKSNDSIGINLVLKEFGNLPINFEEKTELEAILSKNFGTSVLINVELINYGRLNENTQHDITEQFIKERITKDLELIAPLVRVHTIAIDYSIITNPDLDPGNKTKNVSKISIILMAPSDFEIDYSKKIQLSKNINELLGSSVEIDLKTIEYTQL